MNFGLHKRGKTWCYDFYIKNKRYRGSTKTTSKELAINLSQKIYTELYQCKYNLKNSSRVKITDFIGEHLRLLEGNISNEWLKNIKYIFHQFLSYLSEKSIHYLDEIDTLLLENYRNHQLVKNKKNTVKNAMVVVGSMLNRAVRLDYLAKNPSKNLAPLHGVQKNKQRFLTQEEKEKVIEVTRGTYLENLVLTALYTGMRRRELIHLEYQDIDINRKPVHVRNKTNFTPKSRKERVFPLHQKLFHLFEGDKQGYCFLYEGGRIIQEDTASRNFKELMLKIGLTNVGLHTLRHTFVSQCLMAGISMWEVAKWVGHSTTHVTELYGHLCPERREIDRLDI